MSFTGLFLRRSAVGICIALFFMSAAVGQAADLAGGTAATSGRLLITGSSTMCPLIADIGRQFRSLHDGVTVEVQCGGSDRGIRDIRDGKADIAMIARALGNSEKGLYGFPMARDGASLIIHKSNPVKSLSKGQVAAIFSGKTTNWKQVGGPDAPITVILREKEKPITELLINYFNLAEIRGRIVPGDNPVTISAVAANRHAIGYVSSGEAERSVRSLVPIKLLPVNNVMPTDRNIITGNYPLARPLTLVTRDLPVGMVKEFINYCLSSKVVDTIVRFDFVPYED